MNDMKATATTPRVETEVTEKRGRRRFPKEYKLRILQEADACTRPGEVGALLRREGLYSSHLTHWREQRLDGTLKALERKRGPKPKRTTEQVELAALRRDNEKLREKLRKAEKIIEVQKKLSELLGLDVDDTKETT
jgi:transposase-like protein